MKNKQNTNFQHTLTNAQPVPKLWSAPSSQLPRSLYAKHGILWYGMSPWSAWVSCLGQCPPQLFVHLLTGRS